MENGKRAFFIARGLEGKEKGGMEHGKNPFYVFHSSFLPYFIIFCSLPDAWALFIFFIIFRISSNCFIRLFTC